MFPKLRILKYIYVVPAQVYTFLYDEPLLQFYFHLKDSQGYRGGLN
jgi:hypothetical protein